jgi:hypothetical protein
VARLALVLAVVAVLAAGCGGRSIADRVGSRAGGQATCVDEGRLGPQSNFSILDGELYACSVRVGAHWQHWIAVDSGRRGLGIVRCRTQGDHLVSLGDACAKPQPVAP